MRTIFFFRDGIAIAIEKLDNLNSEPRKNMQYFRFFPSVVRIKTQTRLFRVEYITSEVGVWMNAKGSECDCAGQKAFPARNKNQIVQCIICVWELRRLYSPQRVVFLHYGALPAIHFLSFRFHPFQHFPQFYSLLFIVYIRICIHRCSPALHVRNKKLNEIKITTYR